MDDISIETVCGQCGGRGGWWGENPHDGGEEWRRCGTCGGAGYEPTPLGEKVLALMRHNFRPLLEDNRDVIAGGD